MRANIYLFLKDHCYSEGCGKVEKRVLPIGGIRLKRFQPCIISTNVHHSLSNLNAKCVSIAFNEHFKNEL